MRLSTGQGHDSTQYKHMVMASARYSSDLDPPERKLVLGKFRVTKVDMGVTRLDSAVH
jgi:hypothetical protein